MCVARVRTMFLGHIYFLFFLLGEDIIVFTPYKKRKEKEK
jgi:hypothetical protein